MVFERAWAVAKGVDFRLPSPSDKPPSYLDRDANLAFHGSRLPNWYAHENPWGDDELSPEDFAQSITDELRRRKGELVMAPHMDYEVGDFGDALEDFTSGGFFERRDERDSVLLELERAGMVRALMDAGIVNRREISDALDETTFASGRGKWSPGQIQIGGPPVFPRQTYRHGPYGTEYAQDQNERHRLQREHEAKYPEPQRRGWLTTQLGGPED